MDLLAELNSLRERDGKTPLKKWAGTEQQLRHAIYERKKAGVHTESDDELVRQYLANGGEVHKGRDHSAKGVKRQGGRRRITREHANIQNRKPPVNGGRVTDRGIPDDCFTLVELAKERGTSGSYVRKRAREIPGLADFSVGGKGRWIFPLSLRKKVVRLLWPNG